MRMLMKGLVVVAVAFVCVPSAQALFEMDLTVDPGNTLGGGLSDFPVLVKLTPGRTNGYAGLGGDGSTLRFYQGATMLAHEIEDWNVGGESNVWVKVPTISTGGATTITAKWDGGMPAALPTTDVWSNGFIGVYHLNETAGPDIFDSTAGANNGVVVSDPTVNAAGQINGGMTFAGTQNIGADPTDDAINLGDVFDNLGAMTLEAWMNPVTEPARNYSLPFGKGDVDDNQAGTTWGMETVESAGWVHFYILDDDTNGHIRQKTADGVLVQGVWQHVAGTWNGGTEGTDVKVYVDGVDESLTPGGDGAFEAMRDTEGKPAVIAAGLAGTRYENFEGGMDEVRFSDVDRSDDWMMSTYLSGGDNYVRFGDVVPEPATLSLLVLGGVALLRRKR